LHFETIPPVSPFSTSSFALLCRENNDVEGKSFHPLDISCCMNYLSGRTALEKELQDLRPEKHVVTASTAQILATRPIVSAPGGQSASPP
jgi:hypothetical protein